ncbi:MAG TPA: CPBP family intramembrane glutamic endopeptidase, partial [Minicystis sp.]|nr:CPBP family intramembrane glutamic endopeptidase [Minicystis sp.]
ERRLRALVGRVPGSAVELWADVALATGCVLAAVAIERALGGGDARHAEAVRAMLPRSGVEHAAWALVAVSVGVGEELVYRGYLMRQFAAWTGRAGAGLVLQAALFGVAHLEQGPGAAVRVGILGALLGLIALGRGSLVPAILAHVAIDLAAGFA